VSTLNVDKVDPSTGTALEIGSSGDTITIPSGATIVNSGTATGFGTTLTGSTNNTVTTVTAANAISGEANLQFDGTDLTVSTGNVVLGTSGKGIDFSANTGAAGMVSQLLDDYEEGTFTPTITSSGSDPTQSYATQVGHYVKIGNLVQVQGYVQTAASGVSGGSGTDCFVDALPFTSKNTTNQRSGMSIGYASTWGTTRGVPTNAAIHPNQTRMYLKVQNNASNILSTVLTQVSAADVTNGTSVIFGGAYHSE